MKALPDKPIACYYRFSKQEQDNPESRSSHIFQLERAVESLGRLFDEQWLFSDVGSGTKSKRPQFQKLIELIKSRSLCAVVGRTDRLARNAEANAALARLLEENGVLFFDVLKSRFLDFSNPDDWADFHNQGVGNEKESRVISKRIKMRFEFNRSQGKTHGGRTPHGYRRSPAGVWEPNKIPARLKPSDPATWEEAQKMIEIFCRIGTPSASVRAIAEELNLNITYRGFQRWLQNPVLDGSAAWLYGDRSTTRNASVREIGNHEALVSPELRQTINTLLAASAKRRGKAQNFRVYPLSGLLWCDRCGSPAHIVGQTRNKGKSYGTPQIHCRDRRKFRGCNVEEGGKLGTNYDYAQHCVIQALMERAEQLAAIAAAPKIAVEETDEIREIKMAIARLVDLQMPEVDGLIRQKQEQLRNAIAALSQEGDVKLVAGEKLIEYVKDLKDPESWEDVPPHELMVLFRDFIKEVRCAGDKVIVKPMI